MVILRQMGLLYNNYLIKDEHTTLIDTVKHDFAVHTIKNIRNLTDPAKIENLVINHIEPDHASSLDKIMSIAPNITIYITNKGKKGLDRHFDISRWNIKVVKTGDSINNTGKYTLTFLETPMLHWPDSMMTYIKKAKLLISQDAFGQHMATSARFDDEFIESESLSVLDDTERMTIPMMQGIKDEGVACKVIKLRSTPMSVAIKEFWKARGCLIGSPTLNNILFPSVAEYLTHLRGLRPKNRIMGAFGSYGWGGGAVRDAYDEFKRMKLEVVEPGVQAL